MSLIYLGKTCLLFRYTKDVFPSGYVPTVFDKHEESLVVDGTPVTINLWDIAGQEGYESLRDVLFAGTVSDITLDIGGTLYFISVVCTGHFSGLLLRGQTSEPAQRGEGLGSGCQKSNLNVFIVLVYFFFFFFFLIFLLIFLTAPSQHDTSGDKV